MIHISALVESGLYEAVFDFIWDLTTRKDTVNYTFMDAYEDGIKPRVAVEYRNKI